MVAHCYPRGFRLRGARPRNRMDANPVAGARPDDLCVCRDAGGGDRGRCDRIGHRLVAGIDAGVESGRHAGIHALAGRGDRELDVCRSRIANPDDGGAVRRRGCRLRSTAAARRAVHDGADSSDLGMSRRGVSVCAGAHRRPIASGSRPLRPRLRDQHAWFGDGLAGRGLSFHSRLRHPTDAVDRERMPDRLRRACSSSPAR